MEHVNNLIIIFVVKVVGMISWQKYAQQCIAIAPRHEPLETPCEVKTETRQDWNGNDYTYKTVDKLSNVG
jgi:hypothetical protein